MKVASNNHVVSRLQDSPDNILWQLTESNLSIKDLTKDQRFTLEEAYGEEWKDLVNELTNTSVI